MQTIERFLDGQGKLRQLPSKYAVKMRVCDYLAEKFDAGVEYSEPEVNAILGSWHTFHDYFLLRREMVDCGWLKRLPDGSKYWKNPAMTTAVPQPS